MAKAKGSRTIYCYYCGRRITTSWRTMSIPCPSCNKSLLVEDIVVKKYTGVTNLETCGKLIVRRRGHAVAKHRVVALAGIEVEGKLHCEHALSAGQVILMRKAEWTGDLHATSLVVEEGAKITKGWFKVPEDPLADFRFQEEEMEMDDSE